MREINSEVGDQWAAAAPSPDPVSEVREALLWVFGVPPMVMGERHNEPRPDPRCRCNHWGCRIGYWHCFGTMGDCFVPFPWEHDDD